MSKRRKSYKGRQAEAAKRQRLWFGVALGGLLLAVGVFLVALVSRNGGSETANFTPEATGGPHISVAQDKIDYGEVKLGRTITTEFQVQNVGDQDLTIQGQPRVEVVEGC